MLVVGLTGSIGSGKSYVAKIFSKFGCKIIDADKIAHELLAHDADIIDKIKSIFPDVTNDKGQIERKLLRERVFYDQDNLNRLEEILHPAIKNKILQIISKNRKKVIILEVPLLFEKNFDDLCDIVILTSCDGKIRKNRVINKRNLSKQDFEKISEKQWDDKIKQDLSDIIIKTGLSKYFTYMQVRRVYKKILMKL